MKFKWNDVHFGIFLKELYLHTRIFRAFGENFGIF